ncbi:MAG: leucine-rich repeat domain-containing protein [Lachnospiraceae bacterium]|nr:leucine-rich repeat domain-containing protein [Lachnospiraceae bacterium]
MSYTADNSLLSAELSSTLQEIGDYTFVNCENLQSIKLPEKLEAIGREAFYGCHSLRSIIIPCSVSEIDEGAFADCTNLLAFFTPLQSAHSRCPLDICHVPSLCYYSQPIVAGLKEIKNIFPYESLSLCAA